MDTSLTELKNIHQPSIISVFPLAPGWYLLGILLLIAGGIIFRQLRKKSLRQKQRAEIFQLFTECRSRQHNPAEMLAEISILLKRVAIMRCPEQQTQTLFGEKWLLFLNTSGKTTNFTNGAGNILGNPYQQHTQKISDDFFAVIQQWLRTVL